MTATAVNERRELARRTSDGIEVALYWTEQSSQVTIAALATRTGSALEFEVDGGSALEAFNHPYAFAAMRRVRSAAPAGVAVTH